MDSTPLGKKDTYMMDRTNQQDRSLHFANLSNLRNHLLKPDRTVEDNGKGSPWINIGEKSLMQFILETFVDPEKKKILNLTAEKTLTVPEILQICEVPTTSGYRKINSLIESGLLIKNHGGSLKKGRKIRKYRSIFEDVKISIDMNKISIYAKFAKA